MTERVEPSTLGPRPSGPRPSGPRPSGVLAKLGEMFSGEVRPLKLDATSLAVERTRLACERTMMAWIRTGTSMIAFGFSLYKFFDLQAGVPQRMLGPRGYAFLMILAGLVSVVLAGLQNRQAMQRFRAAGADVPYSLATLLGGLVSIVGIIGLLAVVLRL